MAARSPRAQAARSAVAPETRAQAARSAVAPETRAQAARSAVAPRKATDLDVVLGRKLRAARMKQGLTQSQLATAVGITFQQIQKYENGSNRVAVSTLIPLCRALDVDPASLLPRTMAAGQAAPDPIAALTTTITGLRLAQVCAGLDDKARASLLNIAEAIAGANAAAAAARAA